MIKAVIFDLNGVFLESYLLSDRFQRDFKVKNSDFVQALKMIMPVVRKPKAPSCFSLFKPYLDKWQINLNEQSFFKYWFSGEHPVIELIAYAKTLRQSWIKVFILSNNFKERTRYYKEHFPDIFASVNRAYFSWETGLVKPDKQAFFLILQENHLKPNECLYFDNDRENVAAAQSIGIQAFHYTRFTSMKAILEKNNKKIIK
ncbi:MAG TPA: HAD family hydrolase [Candidatus Nanoarchaeia archaeon]|nr:HAD family hydrolase [Candidatus Nanoarchaeia archaeon]